MGGLKHVYIIGAGFSMPLGGPSFNDLISGREQPLVRKTLTESISKSLPSAIILSKMEKILLGIWKSIGRSSSLVNTEELLEIIDSCESSPSSITATEVMDAIIREADIPQKLGVDFSQVNRMVRLRLAMSTMHFLDVVPNDSERWKPYKRWFGNLTEHDTLITFNYDDVVERTARLCGRDYYPQGGDYTPEAIRITDISPPLLKLHGSATWMSTGFQATIEFDNVKYQPFLQWNKILDDEDANILIGTPGLLKSNYGHGVLKPIWEHAKIAIEQADFVSIVGYSMPATDNDAIQLILDSLAANRSKHLAIDIVLGPSSNSDTSRRMKTILSQVLPGTPPSRSIEGLDTGRIDTVLVQPLYAQDYLRKRQPNSFKELWQERINLNS